MTKICYVFLTNIYFQSLYDKKFSILCENVHLITRGHQILVIN